MSLTVAYVGSSKKITTIKKIKKIITIKIQYNYDTCNDNTRVSHYYWQLLNAHGIHEFLYLFVLVIGIDHPSAVLKVYGT